MLTNQERLFINLLLASLQDLLLTSCLVNSKTYKRHSCHQTYDIATTLLKSGVNTKWSRLKL